MISYSTLQIPFLKTLLKEQYGIDCSSVLFLKRGFNDTYKITAGNDTFILRVYRARRRTLEEINSELNILLFLNDQGLPVSVPLPGLQARFIQEIDTPEGKRAAVLFSFVEGESIRRPSIGQCKVAGEALGAIHEKLSDFAPGPMSWDYQPEKLFAYVRTSVDGSLRNFPDDLHYLTRLQEAVSEKLKGVSLQSGICHGDLQSENFYFLKDGSVSFIDFDFSGYGPLLYDLGAYTWYDHQGKTKEMLHSFYDGYSRHVALNAQEIELIPLFGALRAVFLMGMWNSFMDGESNPIWPADQVSAFVKKLKKWLEKECKMKI